MKITAGFNACVNQITDCYIFDLFIELRKAFFIVSKIKRKTNVGGVNPKAARDFVNTISST